MSTPFRRRVELRAGPVLVLLARLPKIVPFTLVLGLLVAGLLVQGAAGAVLLGLLTLLLALLLFLGWPALHPQSRVVRLVVLLVVAARAVSFVI